jgi:hypothetical protein
MNFEANFKKFLYEDIARELFEAAEGSFDRDERGEIGITENTGWWSLRSPGPKEQREERIAQLMLEIEQDYLPYDSQVVGEKFEGFIEENFKGASKTFTNTNPRSSGGESGEKSPFSDLSTAGGTEVYSVKLMNADKTNKADWPNVTGNNFSVKLLWWVNSIFLGNYNKVIDKGGVPVEGGRTFISEKEFEELDPKSWEELEEIIINKENNMLEDDSVRFGIIWGRIFTTKDGNPVLQLHRVEPLSAREIFNNMTTYRDLDSKTKNTFVWKAVTAINHIFETSYNKQSKIEVASLQEEELIKKYKKGLKKNIIKKKYKDVDKIKDDTIDYAEDWA